MCGKDQEANQKHPKAEVMADIRKPKQQHPTALLSLSDMKAVYTMTGVEQEDSEENQSDVRWAEDDGGKPEEERDFGFGAEYDWAISEEALANS